MGLLGLGSRLRLARHAAEQTQASVADVLKYSVATIANWERERTEPCASDLLALARLYSVSADWLLVAQRLPHRFDAPPACMHHTPTTDRCVLCEAVSP